MGLGHTDGEAVLEVAIAESEPDPYPRWASQPVITENTHFYSFWEKVFHMAHLL